MHGEMKVTIDPSKLSPEEAATMVRLAEKAKVESLGVAMSTGSLRSSSRFGCPLTNPR